MSNEELAVSIQNGQAELLPVLWEQVERFADAKAKDYFYLHPSICAAAGVTVEDLQQEAYFGFLEAIRYYDSAKGYGFLSFMKFPLQNAFNQLCGMRTEKQRRAALNNARSIYEPIGDEDLCLMDMLEDEEATEKFEAVHQKAYIRQLRDDLELCLATLPEVQRGIIKDRFYEGLSAEKTGERFGLTAAQCSTQEAGGLRKMRNGKNAARLKAYREDIISHHFNYSGFGFWNRTGMSSTECAVLKREQAEEKYT